MAESKPRERGKRLNDAVGIVLLVVFSPVILVWVVFNSLYGLVLYITIWFAWCVRGRNVLFVYSESPIWREYIEKEILPYIADRAVVLNWSERKRWGKSLAVIAFRRFGGWRAFNPLAVVFRPFHIPKVLRFYEPFQEFKHGQPAKVEKLKTELFEALSAASHKQTA